MVGTAIIGAMPAGLTRVPSRRHPEIPERAGLADHQRHGLGRIQRRAAAEGDDAVVAAGLETFTPSSTFLPTGLP